jgi:TPR repeat protein
MCCLVATANAAPEGDAKAAYDKGDYEQALKILRPLAAQGYAVAQNNIGAMYDKGQGVAQNDQEALKWFRLAATQGYATAQNNIGGMYVKGQGVAQNYQEALKWYRLAAAQGLADAQYRIGGMYLLGREVAQNDQEALKWFRLAAAQWHADAQHGIGAMYLSGRGVIQNDQEALKWFRLAATQQGHAGAQYGIGAIYLLGREVAQNDQEALKWFRLAAAQGHADAIKGLKSPSMVAAAQNSTPDRRSTSIKTGTKQEEQVSIKTNQKTEQARRITARAETPERASPPKLIFSSSTPKSDGTVELSGRVISDASISEILINGRALEVSLGRDNSFTVTRGLPMGAVTSYRLSVMDEYGQKAETEINVERAAVQYAEQVAPLNPRKLKAQANPNAVALIIGVESYSNLPPAQYADSDATHFYDYASQSLGVPPNKIKLLTDSKANRTELLKAMRSWMRTEIINGKSDVYIFFAGHGLASADGSKTYLLPADGDRDLLEETSILRDDLIASAKGAKTITMFLDTCYSGGTRTNEVLLADARPIAIVPDKSALPSNVTVLAAASGSQLSSTYEAAQQGLFSYWLMKGLEGDADTNKDKKITTGELHEYVARQVGPMAQRRNRQQDPQLMGDSTRVLVSY